MKAAALFELTGRVAMVTGASSGIGRAIAAALADAGARIVLVARRANALEAACAEIKRAGGEASIVPCDLATARRSWRARNPHRILLEHRTSSSTRRESICVSRCS